MLNDAHVGRIDVAALSLSYRKRLNPALKKSSTTTSKYTVRPSKRLKCLYCYFYSLPFTGVEAGVAGERQGALIFGRSKVKVPPESRSSANFNQL